MDLFERASRGDLDGVKELVQKGADVNDANDNDESVLYVACENGQTEVALYLLECGASLSQGAKPLIVAAKKGHRDCVELLLNHHADVNCTDSADETAVQNALRNRDYATILVLLKYGATPSSSLTDVAHKLVMHAKPYHAGAIAKLLDNDVIDLTSEVTFLATFGFAFKRGVSELAQRMLSNDSYSEMEKLYPFAAYYSAKCNWASILLTLLEKGVDVNETTKDKTPLYVACEEGHEPIVTILLNGGADPNVSSKASSLMDLQLPIQIAVHCGNIAIFGMLMEKCAQLELQQAVNPLLHIASGSPDAWKTASGVQRRTDETSLQMIRLLLGRGLSVNALSIIGDTALYRACSSQQLETAKALLEAGADVNQTKRRLYPLMAACKTVNAELVNLLLNAGADAKCTNEGGETCLHVVVYGHYDDSLVSAANSDVTINFVGIIKLLLAFGADVNARCWQQETALYRASRVGDEDITRALLEAGARTSGPSNHDPLYVACELGHIQIVDLLLKHDVKSKVHPASAQIPQDLQRISSMSSSICCAIKKGFDDIVGLLLEYGADVNKRDINGKAAVIHAVECLTRQGHHDGQLSTSTSINILQSMLAAGGDINLLSESDGLNALHISILRGRCDILTELIQYGADCNQPTANGLTAVDLACKEGHEEAVELLLKSGAKSDRKSETSSHAQDRCNFDLYRHFTESALCSVAQSNNESLVKMLLRHGADANTCNRSGNTALHLTTSSTIMEVMLKAGANVNIANKTGQTALSRVCSQPMASLNVVEMLLSCGADANMHLPLYDACENSNAELVELLLKYGADANLVKQTVSQVSLGMRSFAWIFGYGRSEPKPDTKLSVLCIACKQRNRSMVECLLKSGATVGFRDSCGNTPLLYAVQKTLPYATDAQAYDPIVTLLLQHSAPVNVVSDSGETPLCVACQKGVSGVVKQLLDCKADIGFTESTSGKNLLLIACEGKFREIALMLLNRGAAANASIDEQTPLKVAASNGDVELVKELLRRGADVNQMESVSGTALHVAVVPQKGLDAIYLVKIVRMLLANGANPNALNSLRETPLYLASKHAGGVKIDIIQALLENGADPNTFPDRQREWRGNWRPLTAAAQCKNTVFTALLIKYGATIDHRESRGRTALHYAVGCDALIFDRDTGLHTSDGDTSTVKQLLAAGAKVNVMDNAGATPLYWACKVVGNGVIVKFLLGHGADPNTGNRGLYAVLAACHSLCYEALRLLLEYKVDVSVCDTTRRNALHYVLQADGRQNGDNQEKHSLVQLLLDTRKIDINAGSLDGKTPLYVACSEGLMSIVYQLSDHGANVNANVGEKMPLNAACRNMNVPLALLMLTKGANPNAMEVGKEYGNSSELPLIIAASKGSCELVELLLKHGADINSSGADGNTPLHSALSHGRGTPILLHYSYEVVMTNDQKSVIDLLLENKADVNMANNSDETPLFMATSRGLLDIVAKMLETYGGNPNKSAPDKNPLTAAVSAKNVRLVDELLKHGADPNLGCKVGDLLPRLTFPLAAAVIVSSVEIVKSLLNAGAVVNAMTSAGQNALCIAFENLTSGLLQCYKTDTYNQCVATIHVLLERGADTNSLTSSGSSLVNLVVSCLASTRSSSVKRKTAFIQLLQLLLQNGASLRDSSDNLRDSVSTQSNTLMALSRFDSEQGFLVDLLRAGAGFKLLSRCCLAVARENAESIRLCQAAVLAGYKPLADELQNLQQFRQRDVSGLLQQLLDWLDDDRQNVPSLQRQCRVAIRQQLSAAANFRSILPAIEKLPLPTDLSLYLKFEGPMTDVDFGTSDVRQARVTSPEQQRSQRMRSAVLDSIDSDDDIVGSTYMEDASICSNDDGSDFDHCSSNSDSEDGDDYTMSRFFPAYDNDNDDYFIHMV